MAKNRLTMLAEEIPPTPPEPPRPAPPIPTPPDPEDVALTPPPGPIASPLPLPPVALRSHFLPNSHYTYRVSLSGRTASIYATAAAYRSCDPEMVMEERLVRYADAPSETPLTFTDEQRRHLLNRLGTADPESIIRHIDELTSATVAGTPLQLTFTTQQLERAATRCVSGETLQQKLQEYCDYGVDLQTGLG